MSMSFSADEMTWNLFEALRPFYATAWTTAWSQVHIHEHMFISDNNLVEKTQYSTQLALFLRCDEHSRHPSYTNLEVEIVI